MLYIITALHLKQRIHRSIEIFQDFVMITYLYEIFRREYLTLLAATMWLIQSNCLFLIFLSVLDPWINHLKTICNAFKN